MEQGNGRDLSGFFARRGVSDGSSVIS
jgi:hypothetical protein